MKLTKRKTVGFELPIKRLYLPYTLECVCSKCGHNIKWDFEQGELSYPDVYSQFNERIYCGACDNEFDVKLTLDISLTLGNNFLDYKNLGEIEKQSVVDGVMALISSLEDVNMTSVYGVTAMVVATYHNMIHVVEELMSELADPTITDLDGETPLNIAKERGHELLVDMLTKYNYDYWDWALNDKVKSKSMELNRGILGKLIVEYRGDEPMNGDEIEEFVEKLTLEVRSHEGDISEEDYINESCELNKDPEFVKSILCDHCGNKEEISGSSHRSTFIHFTYISDTMVNDEYICETCNNECIMKIEEKLC